MKNEKNYVGFRIPKVWQILNIWDFAFVGIFASENRTVYNLFLKIDLLLFMKEGT